MDYSKQVHPLNNTILYAKGWYKKTNNIFEDLKKCLRADGYIAISDSDVVNILVCSVEQYNEWLRTKEKNELTFRSFIGDLFTYKYTYNIENEAERIVRVILSFYFSKGYGDICLDKPDFKKVGLKYSQWKQGITNKEIERDLTKIKWFK